MIIPCIDLMGGKVVQLIQGKTPALELDSVDDALRLFQAFPLINVIDLDAAMGQGNNDALVEDIVRKKRASVGGGVRSVERAQQLIDTGAEQVIVGTRAFAESGVDHKFLTSLTNEIETDRIIIAIDSLAGQVAIKGWRENIRMTPVEAIKLLEPYCGGFLCTFVDNEGTMRGTDLNLFRSLRAATSKNIIAAGGIAGLDEVRELVQANIQVALGMAIYTGRLKLDDLLEFA
ncbi:MAG: hypothetical protein KF824_01645 [Fimbriimonadaceae bacterium]|nr:MAG: hypothetical protein KF824_01645 [Fimbriimonadaceae bacterium]